MPKSYKIYIHLAIFFMVAAIIMYFWKMHQFEWGKLPIFKDKSSFNDRWYYIIDCFSNTAVLIAFSYIATLNLNIHQKSIVCWVFKYIVIEVAVLGVVRSLAGIITYDKFSIYEIALALLSTIYVAVKAMKWYKTNIKKSEPNSRGAMAYN